MMDEIIVSIVSKNEIVREGLRRILIDQEFVVFQAVNDIDELEEDLASKSDHSLIIVDSNSFSEGVSSCRQLRERFCLSRIVLMADDYSIENVGMAFGAGVDGYLVKAISCEPLGGALRLISMGEKVFPSQIAESLLDPTWRSAFSSWGTDTDDLNLSGREIEILRCLVSGEANKVISRRLHITEATVKVHIKAILRKLRVTNRTQAAIWAVTRGLNHDTPLDGGSAYGDLGDRASKSLQVA